MKKFSLIAIAAVLAIAFSAFTTEKKTNAPKATTTQAWFYLPPGQDAEDETEYVMTDDDGEEPPTCPNEGTNVCGILATVQESTDPHPGQPDLDDIAFTLKRTTP
ncbi:MAG: hypothetical protein WDN26_16740 [Chitinophagaceae bacterium]